MTNNLKDPLVWIDCEMTGLDLEQDCLVEVAVIITDGQTNIVDEGIDLLIKPKAGALENGRFCAADAHQIRFAERTGISGSA